MNKRSYKRTSMNRRRKVRRYRFYAIIFLLIGLSIFGFKFSDKKKAVNEAASMDILSKEEEKIIENAITPKIENKDFGEIESIIEYGTQGFIAVHYPLFNKDNIDSINKKFVTGFIDAFKEEISGESFPDKANQYELNIDYDTDLGPNNIISITYTVFESSSYMAHPNVRIVTKAIDLSKDLEVDLDYIMDNEYLEYISQLSKKYFSTHEIYKDSIDSDIFEQGISPTKDNYSNFILKEDKIIIIFNKYQLFSGNFGMPIIEIPYTDLKDYIKPELLSLFTNEVKENLNQVEVEKEQVHINAPKRIIDPNKPMIALTFDDGPNKKTTLPILDILKEYNSAATFFVLGNRVSDNGDILKRMIEEGSEIGNHSFNHKELTKLSPPELTEQIQKTQNAVLESTGKSPKLIRPTYGSFNDDLKSGVNMPLILWSVDTLDWKSRDAKKVTNHVLENVKDGDIILMHDIYESTAEATITLVPKLIQMGYQLVTVSELYEARGETLKAGEIYSHIQKK